MTPAVSIVIPLLRQNDEWLRQCVSSALSQSAPCEVIAVHSERTPASNLEVLARLNGETGLLRVVKEDKPGNFPAAINLGIYNASTRRIGLLLSDDWLDTDAVAECLPWSADIVCTGHTIHSANGTIEQKLTRSKYDSLPTMESKAGYLEHFFLFRKEALLRAGGLDEGIGNYPGIDDYDLIWTMLELGATVSIVEKCLYHYRDHEGERLTLADPAEARRNLEKILRKHGVAEPELGRLVQAQARWFGRPVHRVIAEG